MIDGVRKVREKLHTPGKVSAEHEQMAASEWGLEKLGSVGRNCR